MTVTGVTADPSGNWTVVPVAGEIDLSNVDALGESIMRGVSNLATGLVLDLSGVRYLDSAGLRLLFTVNRRLEDRQQSLRLVVPPTALISRVLVLSGVAASVRVFPSVADAVAGERGQHDRLREREEDGLLEIRSVSWAAATVVTLAGEIDVDVAPRLRSALTDAAEAGAPLLVVDLNAVSFLDSSGLAAFVSVNRQLPVGQALALANVPPRLQRVLRATAMNSMLTVHHEGDPWPWPDVPQP